MNNETTKALEFIRTTCSVEFTPSLSPRYCPLGLQQGNSSSLASLSWDIRISSLYKIPSTSVKNVRQIHLFMQNKAKYKIGKMNIRILSKMAYKYRYNWTLSENETNRNIKLFENSPFLCRLVDCMKENHFCFTGRDYV